MSTIKRGERTRVATREWSKPRDEVVDAIVGTLETQDAIHFLDVDFKYFAMKAATARARLKRLDLATTAKVVQSYDPQTRHGVAWVEARKGADAEA